MNRLKQYQYQILIVLFGLIFYIPFLGQVHLFDWDEINFAESAREMIVSGNYLDVQINFQSFWEKPPLFIWLQVLSMKLFGINEFAARFPNAICGILSLLALFNIGRKFKDEKFAVLWVLSFAASILPFFYFKSGIIDPWFNLFIFLGFAHFAQYLTAESFKLKNLILSALYLGLAILTKGPVALLIFILAFVTFLIVRKFRIKTSLRDILVFSVVISITGGFWFILQILSGNFQIIQDFVIYQIRLFTTKDAGHGGFLLYHFVVLLFGVFPASIFALGGFKGSEKDNSGSPDFRLWMLILFAVVLILFTIVKTKIVHYSSLCYFPLTFFSAVFLYRVLYQNKKFPGIIKISGVIIATIIGLIVSALTIIDKFKVNIVGKDLINDPFAEANLSASVNWSGYEVMIGLVFIFSVWFFFFRGSRQEKIRIYGILLSTVLFTYFSVIFITPRFEAYSQRAAIEFYKSVAHEDAYITTLGFKSYAHLFYGEVKPQKSKEYLKTEWLLNGEVEKPVYLVFKINRKERYLKQYPMLEILYEKNGYVFAKRKVIQKDE